MYDQFRWTNASARRNRLTMEYEPVQPFFLIALAEQAGCATFLDIGANIGVYSFFATLVASMRRVVAFEANPATIVELRTNVGLNELADAIEVQPKAISDSSRKLKFGVISKLSGANSVLSTTIHDQTSFHDQLTVDAVPLDDAFRSPIEGPLCVKIDVEGHEAQVIEGARKILAGNKAVIQVEGYAENDGSASAKLKDIGYSQITAIGPDLYFTNIEALLAPPVVIGVYEEAMRRLIEYNHRNKVVTLKRGDLAIQLTGKTGDLARAIAKRLIGRHL